MITQVGAPTVDAGANQTVVVTSSVSLNGTVTDDGLPYPVTTTWSVVSGANMVTVKATLNTVEKVGKNTKKAIPIEKVKPDKVNVRLLRCKRPLDEMNASQSAPA